ncbi:MAG: hypothetical protein E6G57_06820 [Actinobacteria bacterium]|nr:MAG: hypothetical protein E6G57_06820 [Actinomycetota bacterium]
MNHEPFDEHLSRELRSLVADADPPPTLRPGVASARRLPRPLIVGGSIAAAVIAIVALLVSPGSGSHRQRVASEGGTTTTENGTLVPVPGVQSTALPSPASTTTTTPRRASTTLPVIAGKPTTTTTPPPRPLAATHYSLGSGMTQYWGITEGPDGNMWAVSWGDIARITPGGQVTKFAIRPVPYQGAPAGITAGPDGNLWFTEVTGDKVGRITPTGQITEFAAPAAGAITTGPDGAIWFTAGNSGVGKITTSGSVTTFATPGGASGIARGSDGNLWFAGSNSVGRITTAGVVTQYPAPHSYRGVASGADGNLWFQPDYNGGPIARVTTSGDVKEFGGAAGSPWPTSISAGPDGNVWCLQSPGHLVYRVDHSGKVTAFSDDQPQPLNQYGIATGPGGTLWLTDDNGVAKFSPPSS